MLTVQIKGGPGLGLFVDTKHFRHNGGNKGFRCRLVATKNTGHGLVIMTNSNQGDKTYSAITKALLESLAKIREP